MNERKDNIIVEVAFKLDKDLNYYIEILKKNNAINDFNCETYDIYYTKERFDEKTENEIKNSCVRYRNVKLENTDEWKLEFNNYQIFDDTKEDRFIVTFDDSDEFLHELEEAHWEKKITTYKKDYQYKIGNMKSKIQLQDIENIGLVLYYDNPDYYDLNEIEQRQMLINELNSYGFAFKENELCIDKLRTIINNELKYSVNQNK